MGYQGKKNKNCYPIYFSPLPLEMNEGDNGGTTRSK
jgi:hypothetical protein